jgi:hypothetical protein
MLRIGKLPADLNAEAYVSDIKIVDPSMASFNYMEYRNEAIRSVANNVGNTIFIALFDLNFHIWN